MSNEECKSCSNCINSVYLEEGDSVCLITHELTFEDFNPVGCMLCKDWEDNEQ